jgi:hypothetical protein
MKKRLNPLLFIGLIGFFVFGSNLAANLYEVFYGNQSIWWTPKKMMLTLDETKDYFELWITGKIFQSRIEDGSLFLLDNEGNQFRVVSKDVGVRINNWQSRQVALLKYAVINACITGACLAFVFAVIIKGIK